MMNLTMKRTDIIAKLEELMPLFKTEDKRLLDIYKREMAEYSVEVQKRVKKLARMKRADLMEFLRKNDVDKFIKGPFIYRNHNRLYNSYYRNEYRQPFYPEKFRYVDKAEYYLKQLNLSSVRQFTLTQDGKYSELWRLVNFEPHTENA